ncbi:unnamed protein product [Cochlearia groenlandica]
MKIMGQSGGAWLVSPSLAVSLRRMKVSGFATFSSSSVSNWEGGVSLVQGASRGIGLEFVKQLLEKSKKGLVVATCRNPKEATSLF